MSTRSKGRPKHRWEDDVKSDVANSQLNFLDITIHRATPNWEFAIYRKPTFTDNIIPYNSNHPN